jgi:hypothetical protein
LPGKFASYTMSNDNEYRVFLKSFEATGLAHILDDKEVQTVITSLEDIAPGERYEIVASYITSIRNNVTWSQSEVKAMEDEVLLAVKNFLNKMFKLTVEIFPERIMHKNKITIMEFDGILTCGDQVFLLEAKHKMTDEHITSLINRLREFETNLKITDSLEFKKLMGKQFVGVACGTSFADKLRSESMNKGLVVVYPSGSRYKVDAPQELMDKVKVCTFL